VESQELVGVWGFACLGGLHAWEEGNVLYIEGAGVGEEGLVVWVCRGRSGCGLGSYRSCC